MGIKIAGNEFFYFIKEVITVVSNNILFLAQGELAYHGHRVKVYDSQTSSLNSAYSRIEEDKRHLMEEGLLSSTEFVVFISHHFNKARLDSNLRLCVLRVKSCLSAISRKPCAMLTSYSKQLSRISSLKQICSNAFLNVANPQPSSRRTPYNSTSTLSRNAWLIKNVHSACASCFRLGPERCCFGRCCRRRRFGRRC